jgi:acyl transferase domain-containing protein
MKSAGDSYENYLKRFKFAAPSIPVISNVTAKEYQADSVVENLSAQISNTVRWLESIEYLKSLESDDEIIVEEVGHGDVLTKIYMTIESERKANTSSEDQSGVAVSASKRDEDEVKTESSESELNVSASTEQPLADSKTDDSSAQSNGQSDVVELATETITAQEKVADWNRQYGVGTTVRSSNNDYGNLVTRTDGVVLFGHRAAVYMEGYKGYFDLDELHPLEKSAS